MTTDLERVLSEQVYVRWLEDLLLGPDDEAGEKHILNGLRQHDAALRALLREALSGWSVMNRLLRNRIQDTDICDEADNSIAEILRAVFGESTDNRPTKEDK